MIDKNKKYTTRDGHPVRIYATDGCSDYPVHGAIFVNERWVPWCWTSDGSRCSGNVHAWDLIDVPPRIKGWVNIYPESLVHSSRESADKFANPDRIACIEIDVEHGHGLEGK